jgi:hypothetical protein
MVKMLKKIKDSFKCQRFFVVIFFISLAGYSQKKLIDSITNNPISFVEMYSEKGIILGTTDYDSEISIVQLNKIINKGIKQLYFHHNNYKDKKITIEQFLNSDNISLIPLEIEKPNILDEVMLFSKSNKKYIKFTAYFRNIQFNNSQPQYYMDGIVDYYISNKNGKAKICVLQNRSLKDVTIKQIDEKGMVRLNFNIAGVPNFDDFIDFEKIKNEYVTDRFGNTFFLYSDGMETGKLEAERENIFLSLEIYSPERPKVMKLFGTESILKKYSVNAIYNDTHNNLKHLKDLLYFKEYREYDIKQKKVENYTYITTINEVFIVDKEFTDEEPSSKDSFYSFIDKSNYEEPFWESIKSDYIVPLPKTVNLFIKDKLAE